MIYSIHGPAIITAQYIIGTDQDQDAGIKCDYRDHTYSQDCGEIVLCFRLLT